MKNSSDIIGNRTRDFPACNAGLQPILSPRSPPLPSPTNKHIFKVITQHIQGYRLQKQERLPVSELSFELCSCPLLSATSQTLRSQIHTSNVAPFSYNTLYPQYSYLPQIFSSIKKVKTIFTHLLWTTLNL